MLTCSKFETTTIQNRLSATSVTTSWAARHTVTWVTVLPDKLIVTYQVKKFNASYKNLIFFTECRHWPLSFATWIHCTLWYRVSELLYITKGQVVCFTAKENTLKLVGVPHYFLFVCFSWYSLITDSSGRVFNFCRVISFGILHVLATAILTKRISAIPGRVICRSAVLQHWEAYSFITVRRDAALTRSLFPAFIQ